MQGKIALEEHVFLQSYGAYGADPSALEGATKAHNYDPTYFADVQKRLGDATLRLQDMDRCGIERVVLSLTQPGIQSIPDRKIAVETAKRMNNDLAEQVLAAHPSRFAGFAAVALQDVSAAGEELERAVSKLGFKGAMINGYTNIGDMNTAQYLDEPPVWDFWARVEALDVPIYLHPRSPLPNQRRVYEGYPVLADAPWGFGAETAAHTLRLILSGLFDRFPRLKVILGHQGEGLPFLLPRVESRLRHASPEVRGRQLKPVTHYLRENFCLTTAGAFRTQALIDTLLEVGSDHVLFSVDYPLRNDAGAVRLVRKPADQRGGSPQDRPIECPAAAASRLITTLVRFRLQSRRPKAYSENPQTLGNCHSGIALFVDLQHQKRGVLDIYPKPIGGRIAALDPIRPVALRWPLTSTSARNGAVPVPSSTDALRNTMLLIASPESSRSQRDDRNNDSIQIVRVGGRKV